jgi:MoaA/NifB/PqqE/SkfB family radical SAM enzyme
MCGRRKLEKMGQTNWGDMDYSLLMTIACQIPPQVVIQFHNNGEPLLYPALGRALEIFPANIRCLNTNGKLLMEKADQIIGNLETLTLSVVQDDPEAEEQYHILTQFLAKKGLRKPLMVYRLLGKVESEKYERLPGVIARRVIHNPMGSYDYQKMPIKPEIGICLDLLTHLAIDRYGWVSQCVRFDPTHIGVLGNLKHQTLEAIWSGEERYHRIQMHLNGDRKHVCLCSNCAYWGVQTG